ncbi:MAG: DUF533 domain-containing protein [Gammaproteobacteria bacterium]|nr:DUF533 domain-containing protein [Gammaproteobacteria bacterium]
MVDAVKILGALLGGGGMSAGSGSNILKSVVNAAVSGNQSGNQSGGGLGDLLGSVLGNQKSSSGNSPLGDILGGVLGGAQGEQQSSGGGLGDLMGSVLGGGSKPQPQQGGNISDLLGGLLGGQKNQGDQGEGMDLGKLVGAALNQFGHSEQAAQQNAQPRQFADHSPDLDYAQANEQATLILQGMINAAKADGRLDEEEKAKITGQLGQVDQSEIEFINNELSKPLNTEEFVSRVPKLMANQVYAMSLTAIDLDSNPEAQYLHSLAQGLGLEPDAVNQIHQQLGAPKLY